MQFIKKHQYFGILSLKLQNANHNFFAVMKRILFTTLLAGVSLLGSCQPSTTAPKGGPDFVNGISSAPYTFCNPLDIVIGNERSYRGGEPVVILYHDDYYLFVSHRKGYWYSSDFRDWTYVDAPAYPGGVVSVVILNDKMYGCSMNNRNVFSTDDPKSGKWEKVGELESDRYGDANMWADDDGRLYLYYGWSQIMPFKVVELDPTTFKVKRGPEICFFGDYKNHGFEARHNEDVIYSIFNGRRDYFSEEYPWIEGPWMTKHNGKYYLQYAAIGLELLTYSHGVYVADNPMGPFTYSEHNPLTYKTTGFQVGAGHGSTFHDRNGQLWTICMIPASYGGAGRGSELAIYPTAVDKDGVMHSNVAFGDYPQYYPGVKKDAVDNNYTGWKLLSYMKKAEVSSTLEGSSAVNAVDENFLTCWSAATGNPGEYYQLDFGDVAEICAIQLNWDHLGARAAQGGRGGFGGGFGQAGPAAANQQKVKYQCYKVEVSKDGRDWTTIIDKSENYLDLHHDYNELPNMVKARYVKVVNVYTHDEANFCIKDLRIFGNPDSGRNVKVKKFMAVRNPQDRREADLLWEPVKGADGYIVRYGIAKDKLYNSHIVYGGNTLHIRSLNTAPEYYYQVESFDSGLESNLDPTEVVNGLGAEIEIDKAGNRMAYGGTSTTRRVMLKQGTEEYVFDGIDAGRWTVRHSYGPVLWSGELTEADLVGEGASLTDVLLTELGAGTKVTGKLTMRVERGNGSGRIVLRMEYDR